jgi:hypothetical protein
MCSCAARWLAYDYELWFHALAGEVRAHLVGARRSGCRRNAKGTAAQRPSLCWLRAKSALVLGDYGLPHRRWVMASALVMRADPVDPHACASGNLAASSTWRHWPRWCYWCRHGHTAYRRSRRGRGSGGLAEQCCQVIVEDCQCLVGVVGGLDIAGGEGAHDVTPRYPGAARSGPAAGIGAGSFHQVPGTPGTMSAMSTTAMMIRPVRTMACSLPVTPGSWPPPAAGSRCLLLTARR